MFKEFIEKKELKTMTPNDEIGESRNKVSSKWSKCESNVVIKNSKDWTGAVTNGTFYMTLWTPIGLDRPLILIFLCTAVCTTKTTTIM